MPGYLLDTNAIHSAVDLNIAPSRVTNRGDVFITRPQINELKATGRSRRRDALLAALQTIDAVKADGDSEAAASSPSSSNDRAAVIGATAMARGLTLVTDDRELAAAVRGLGGHVISFADFME
jgi:predicted nucleic acid-binding protein